MGKKIIILLLAMVVIFIMMQNSVSVWAYIFILLAVIALWSFIED